MLRMCLQINCYVAPREVETRIRPPHPITGFFAHQYQVSLQRKCKDRLDGHINTPTVHKFASRLVYNTPFVSFRTHSLPAGQTSGPACPVWIPSLGHGAPSGSAAPGAKTKPPGSISSSWAKGSRREGRRPGKIGSAIREPFLGGTVHRFITAIFIQRKVSPILMPTNMNL